MITLYVQAGFVDNCLISGLPGWKEVSLPVFPVFSHSAVRHDRCVLDLFCTVITRRGPYRRSYNERNDEWRLRVSPYVFPYSFFLCFYRGNGEERFVYNGPVYGLEADQSRIHILLSHYSEEFII